MKTIFPEYIDHIEYERNGNPYNGQAMIERTDFVFEEHSVCFILEFLNGKLNGTCAVISDTGYSEHWEEGTFISATCKDTKPRKNAEITKSFNEKLNQVKSDFKNSNYVSDESIADTSKYLPDEADRIFCESLIEDVFKKK